MDDPANQNSFGSFLHSADSPIACPSTAAQVTGLHHQAPAPTTNELLLTRRLAQVERERDALAVRLFRP